MDDQQENVRTQSDVDVHLIEKVWEDHSKGLRKELIDFKYCSVVKASELSKCLIGIIEVHSHDPVNQKSNYIDKENIGKEFWVEIGHAMTPVDCYVEEFLKQMFVNETSKCSIASKSSGDVVITLILKKIEFGGYFCEQSAAQMFELAKTYKENGVKMFKDFPSFAHNYFNLAAKCLLSFNDDNQNNLSDNASNISKEDFEDLLHNVYLNIAACLIKQQRFEDVLHVLKYSMCQEVPSEKAVYRLASAYFHLKQYREAKQTIEKVSYKNNKDLVQLMAKVQDLLKVDNENYSNMVRKMFQLV
jgi:BDBT FKBP like N-terminal/Tetratricopeptide repeat